MDSDKIKIIRENQIDLSLLRNLNIAVIGYGSQGRAQALNLRDSGFKPTIGLLSKSRSRYLARKDGFNITTPIRAVKKSYMMYAERGKHLFLLILFRFILNLSNNRRVSILCWLRRMVRVFVFVKDL